MAVRYGSVCSGIEAATVAWAPLGWEAAWLSQHDPEHNYERGPDFPSAVLAHHYPDVPNLGDMTTIAERVRRGEVEAPDVLTGGTPCQAFSIAGLRKGLTDDRGQLSLCFCDLANTIDDTRRSHGQDPCVVFWENVPGVLSSKDNAFGCFLAGLAGEDVPLEPPGGKWTDAGCVSGPKRAVAWRIFDAQYFKLAQRRRRVFVVASAREGFSPREVLFEFEGVRRDSAPSREAREEITGDAGGGVVFGGSNTSGPIEVAAALNANRGCHNPGDFEAGNLVLRCRPYPAITQASHNTGGIGSSNQEVFAQRGSGLVPVQQGFRMEAFGQFSDDGTASTIKSRDYKDATDLVAVREKKVVGCFQQSSMKGKGTIGWDESNVAKPVKTQADGQMVVYGADLSQKAEGIDFTEEQASCIAPGTHPGHGAHVVFTNGEDVANPISASGGKTYTHEGMTFRMHNCVGHPPVGTLRAEGSVALDLRHGKEAGDIVPAMGSRFSQGSDLFNQQHARIGMQVRRLTPEECEALQGFPRGYTRIPWRKKSPDDCPDGPRYKALGNSWAVPCAAWIGRRIHNHLTNESRVVTSLPYTSHTNPRSSTVNQPAVPPGFQPPPPPPQQTQPPQPPAAPPEPTITKAGELAALIKDKCAYNGASLTTDEHVAWAEQELLNKLSDIDAALRFLRSATTVEMANPDEIKASFHNFIQAPTPPANNISDNQDPPKAAPDPAPEKEQKQKQKQAGGADPAMTCKECGYVSSGKTLRGLKTHIKKTHHMEWEDYCQHHGLASKTGLPLSDVPEKPATGIDDGRPRTAPPASPGVPTVVNEQGHAQAAPPAAPDESYAAPQVGGAPAQTASAQTTQTDLRDGPAMSQLQWVDLPQGLFQGQPDQGVDYRAAAAAALVQRIAFKGPTAVPVEQSLDVADHLAKHFQTLGAQQGQEHYQLCCWLSSLDQGNAYYQLPFDSNGVVEQQPAQPPAPAQQKGPMVTYDPNATPPATIPTQAPQPPQQPVDAANHPDPAVQAAGALLGAAPQEMVQQALQGYQQQETQSEGDKRREYARMLGGEIDCVFVTLADSTALPEITKGRVDANALARAAEMEGVRQITDPEGLKYRRDRQIAERVFADLLNREPKVYVLLNGYDMILDDNFFRILCARICSGGIMRGGQFLPFQF